nr:maleylpyruvate isomerase family mycothiol-dependent enzyme [Nocardioides flavescens]
MLDAVCRESARFREVLAGCDPAARVPACPDWDAADLLWHLAEVQWFWAHVVRTRPAEPAASLAHPERPASYDELLAAFDDHSAALVGALAAADPDETAWHWSADRTVGASYRRQAHEALVHRLDAEQTSGPVTPLDPALAADGVHEALTVMYGGAHPDFASAGGLVAVELTDTGDTLLVEPGLIVAGEHAGPHLVLREEAAEAAPRAVLRGTAGDVDAWLWHRLGDEAVVREGDPALLETLGAALSPALD